MAEELRLALILLGALAIGSVILHGIWTVRRTVNEERKRAQAAQKQEEPVISEEEKEEQQLKLKQMEIDFADLKVESPEKESLPVVDVDLDAIYQEEQPQVQQDDKTNDMFGESQAEHVTEAHFSSVSDYGQKDISIDVINTDLGDDLEPEINISTVETEEEPEIDFAVSTDEEEPVQEAKTEKQEVLMLFVDKPEGEAIEGAKLLPMLLTLGFKFGEMDFFHRYQDNAGNGEILFSLANMYNPGTFDIDSMEQMTTRGLTIFMTLPNAGEALQTFNMMHNAAKKIADEFNATVLNDQRMPIDVARVRQYVDRIRKF